MLRRLTLDFHLPNALQIFAHRLIRTCVEQIQPSRIDPPASIAEFASVCQFGNETSFGYMPCTSGTSKCATYGQIFPTSLLTRNDSYQLVGDTLVGNGGSYTASAAAHCTLLHASMSSNITSCSGSLRRLGIYARTHFAEFADFDPPNDTSTLFTRSENCRMFSSITILSISLLATTRCLYGVALMHSPSVSPAATICAGAGVYPLYNIAF
jgi:hypothetical protein